MTDHAPTLALVAGEASGDLLAAHLIAAVKARLPRARFVGIGGPKMEAEGFEAWWPLEKLAVMGFVEVLKHYREIAGIRRQIKQRLLAHPPALFIGVDAPDFNLGLETALKSRGIPTFHYVSPSIWAWRRRRIKKIARAADRVLALFPMEPPLYEKAGIPVTYVGHPLADEIPLVTDCLAVRENLNLPEEAPVFALLPGSRQSELAAMAEVFVATVGLLHQRYPRAIFLVPLTTRETRLQFEAAMYRQEAANLPIRLLFGHPRDALGAADAALVASGTATLEAALIKRPLVITYKMSPGSYWLMKRLAYQAHVGLPNILAGRRVVPEILQDQATPEALAAALSEVYEDKTGAARLNEIFTDLHRQLRQNTAEKAAAAVIECLR